MLLQTTHSSAGTVVANLPPKALVLAFPPAGVFMWPWAKYPGKDAENHAVTLVGWGIEVLKNGTRLPYWTVGGLGWVRSGPWQQWAPQQWA